MFPSSPLPTPEQAGPQLPGCCPRLPCTVPRLALVPSRQTRLRTVGPGAWRQLPWGRQPGFGRAVNHCLRWHCGPQLSPNPRWLRARAGGGARVGRPQVPRAGCRLCLRPAHVPLPALSSREASCLAGAGAPSSLLTSRADTPAARARGRGAGLLSLSGPILLILPVHHLSQGQAPPAPDSGVPTRAGASQPPQSVCESRGGGQGVGRAGRGRGTAV